MDLESASLVQMEDLVTPQVVRTTDAKLWQSLGGSSSQMSLLVLSS